MLKMGKSGWVFVVIVAYVCFIGFLFFSFVSGGGVCGFPIYRIRCLQTHVTKIPFQFCASPVIDPKLTSLAFLFLCIATLPNYV